MKHLLVLLSTCLALNAFAETDAEHKKETIEQHQAIAAAHQAAAQCLAGGKSEKICHEEMAKSCKGLALGKLCGMRHAH